MQAVTKNDLSVGMTVYDRQARFFDFDYHPQVIVELSEESIKVFEEGYFSKGKHFDIPISRLYFETVGGKQIVIH